MLSVSGLALTHTCKTRGPRTGLCRPRSTLDSWIRIKSQGFYLGQRLLMGFRWQSIMCGQIPRRFPPPQQGDNCGVNARLSFLVRQPFSLLFEQSGCTLGISTEVPGKVPAGSNRALKALRWKGERTILATMATFFTNCRMFSFADGDWNSDTGSKIWNRKAIKPVKKKKKIK